MDGTGVGLDLLTAQHVTALCVDQAGASRQGARREPGEASGGGVEAGFNLRMLLHLFWALNCPAL